MTAILPLMTEGIALGLSGFALLLSIFNLYTQRRAAGRAHFTVHWGQANSLVLTNHGPGMATKVKASVNTPGSDTDPLEMSALGAWQTFPLWLGEHRLTAPTPTEVELSWSDNRRTRQRTTVPLPERPRTRNAAPASDLEEVVREIARTEAEATLADDAQMQGMLRRAGRSDA